MELKDKCLTCSDLVLCAVILGGPAEAAEVIVALQKKLSEAAKLADAEQEVAVE